ncbi:hypothetical protein [Demequina flava]|uniref:hypothetical protein n=1 Tax=Demequina flava TaxID=1095025 RepID=UPI00078555E6|nr:hypothetical protein [Demequina flava]
MSIFLAIVVVAVAVAVSAGLGAILVGGLLRRLQPQVSTPGLLRGGLWVGMLERAIVTGAIALGEPAAVAVVIAVKGLGRYPELRDTEPAVRAQASEQFIIGTLASLGWAGLIGFGARITLLAVL